MMSLDSVAVITPDILSTGVYDEGNPAISYSGSWGSVITPGGPYLDTWRYTNTIGDFGELVFNGRQIKLTYLAGPSNLGVVDVYVDGVKVGTIDQYSFYWAWQKIWVSDLFPAGDHSLRLVYASGGGMVNLDAIEVITPDILSTGVYDEGNPAISYSGAWGALVTPGGPYLDTWRYTNTITDSVQVSFNGRQFRLTYLAGPELGIANIYVDGALAASLNQYSATWDWQKTWISDLFPAGDHSLRIVYASGVGMLNLDAIEVMTPVILSSGVYDDADPAISYSGVWGSVVTPGGPYLDTWRYTNTVGDSAQVGFNGQQFKLAYLAGPDLGIADIYVDGVKVASIDQSSGTWQWQVTWTSDLLPAGNHILRIVFASGGMVNIDELTVLP